MPASWSPSIFMNPQDPPEASLVCNLVSISPLFCPLLAAAFTGSRQESRETGGHGVGGEGDTFHLTNCLKATPPPPFPSPLSPALTQPINYLEMVADSARKPRAPLAIPSLSPTAGSHSGILGPLPSGNSWKISGFLEGRFPNHSLSREGSHCSPIHHPVPWPPPPACAFVRG